jgi:hypothetical protein
MKARTSASNGCKLLQGDKAAPMLAQEYEALTQVARIGFERFRGQPPLGAQMRLPLHDFGQEIRRGAGKLPAIRLGFGCNSGFDHHMSRCARP